MALTPIRLPERMQETVGSGEITFIGNATVLLRYGGFTILTDPNFLHRGDYAKLGGGLRSRRLSEPAMTIDELPALDCVVLSHHHGDHFDEVAIRDLDKGLPIITTPHAARKLQRQGFARSVPLPTWQAQTVVHGGDEVRVTAMPGKHAPKPLDMLLPEVMGSMLEFSRDGDVTFRLYITGDTLVHNGLLEIRRRHPDIDLALLHLGGTKVLGVMLTMDADQGVQALRIVRPSSAIPIHYDDYTVFKSPLADFKAAVVRELLPTTVEYLERGQTHRFATG